MSAEFENTRPTAEIVQSGDELLQQAADSRYGLDAANMYLRMREHETFLYPHPFMYEPKQGGAELVQSAFGIEEGDQARRERQRYMYMYKELRTQILYAFDYDGMGNNCIRYEDVEEIMETPEQTRTFGALLAMEHLLTYGDIRRPDKHTINQAILRLGEVCDIDETRLADMVRICASDPSPHNRYHVRACQTVLREAAQDPSGFIAQTVAAPDGSIESAYFSERTIEKAQEEAFEHAVEFHLHDENPARRTDYEKLRVALPEQAEAFESSDKFYEAAERLLYERTGRYVKSSSDKSLLPQQAIVDIVTLDGCLAIAERWHRDLVSFMPTIPTLSRLPGSEIFFGPINHARIREDANQGLVRLEAAIAEIKTLQSTQS